MQSFHFFKNKIVIICLPSSCSKLVGLKRRYFDMLVTKQLLVAIDLHSMERKIDTGSYQHSSEYHLLCSKEERKSYRFGTS